MPRKRTELSELLLRLRDEITPCAHRMIATSYSD